MIRMYPKLARSDNGWTLDGISLDDMSASFQRWRTSSEKPLLKIYHGGHPICSYYLDRDRSYPFRKWYEGGKNGLQYLKGIHASSHTLEMTEGQHDECNDIFSPEHKMEGNMAIS
ncbi:MAG: hypothetical protein CFH02_01758, partial [Alphaproteobacteria bacterium MarineAlpha3_Bin1]